jgi:dihydroxy-acid dehydratase
MIEAQPLRRHDLHPQSVTNRPGLLMFRPARCNIPAIFVCGGPMEAGKTTSGKTVVDSAFYAWTQVTNGQMTRRIDDIENHACPQCGRLLGMFTLQTA